MHFYNKLDFNYITDGIYIGNNWCCQTHFDQTLIKDGVSAVISLEEGKIDAPFGVEFYLWMPVKNNMAPGPNQLALGVAALEKIVSLGKKVYVHCQNGHGRAPTLVVAYFVKKGQTPEEAEAFVKIKRPVIHLNEIQRQALRRFSEK